MSVVVWDGDAKLKKQVTIEKEQDLLSNVTGDCKAECRIYHIFPLHMTNGVQALNLISSLVVSNPWK